MSDYRSAGQADIPKNLVPTLLKHLIHTDQFLDSVALAAVDLGGDAARRSELAAILRRREAIRVAPGIYGWRDPIGTLVMSQYGDPGPVDMPAPHLVAGAMARQYGWQLAIPVTIARHVLGLTERPDAVHEIPFDQGETRHYAKAKLTLIPGHADLFFLSPAGQCLRQGLPRDASGPGLVEIGEQAGGAAISAPVFLDGLKEDLEDGRLTEREILTAKAIIAHAGLIARRAPKEFVPPAADAEMAALDGWSLVEQDSRVYLTAQRISGHPYLSNSDRLKQTSPVIWIDERLGFARTQSRLYRLGKKDARS